MRARILVKDHRTATGALQHIMLGVLLVWLVAGCATPGSPTDNASSAISESVQHGDSAQVLNPAVVELSEYEQSTGAESVKRPAAEIYRGSGRQVRVPRQSGDKTSAGEGDITLMFQDAPMEEVAMTILGDLLGQAYVIDERVAGTVNLQSGRPLKRDALIPVMEGILKANNAVLIENDGIFQIVPATENLSSIVSPSFELQPDKGFQMIVVPLRYIAANEMKSILLSLRGDQARVHTDANRNLIMVSGTQAELKNMLDTIEIFDVDRMKGMSTGIFRLANAEAKTMVDELNSIFNFNATEEQGSVIRFIEIARLNAVLVITPQASYLDTVEQWVDRLDRADSGVGRTLHVYFVQNVRASYLAGILQELFDADVSSQQAESNAGALAPGLAANVQQTVGVPEQDSEFISQPAATLGGSLPSGPSVSLGGGFSPDGFGGASAGSSGAASGGNSQSPVKIIADEENNALVVKATAQEYSEIEEAIRRLDIIPLQVLVEATIVEVALEGELRYGLEWFFRNNNVISGDNGVARLDLGDAGLAVDTGFSYSIVDSAGGIRAVLNTLAADSKMNIISSPTLMVLDNHQASINVGDQVPVRTSETTNTGTAGADPLVTSTIQFVETGVTLQVAPRVNKGGNVIMDIYQTIRTADATDTSGIDSPTINQRAVQTSVAVQSGETIVLGGLIQDDNADSNSGLPGLRNVPGLGFLFSSTARTSRKTELLVLIKPTAISTVLEAREATEELRQKLKGLDITELKPSSTIQAIDKNGIRW